MQLHCFWMDTLYWPVLGSILALSATEATISKGILLLSFYSLGLAIPFILSGYYMSKFLKLKKVLVNITEDY